MVNASNWAHEQSAGMKMWLDEDKIKWIINYFPLGHRDVYVTGDGDGFVTGLNFCRLSGYIDACIDLTVGEEAIRARLNPWGDEDKEYNCEAWAASAWREGYESRTRELG